MKIGVLKLGMVPSSSNPAGTGEVASLLQLLKLTKLSNKIDFITDLIIIEPDIEKKLREVSNVIDIAEYRGNYDKLIVINGGCQYSELNDFNFKCINAFQGDIYYLHCDPNLFLKDDIFHVPFNRINLISQCNNIDALTKFLNKPYKSIKSFGFEKFPLITGKKVKRKFKDRIIDCLYFGSWKAGRRTEDLTKYFYDVPHCSVLQGRITDDEINSVNSSVGTSGTIKPVLLPQIDYYDVPEALSKAKSTVILSEKLYVELDDIAQRVYESINSEVVTFIDKNADKNFRIYDDSFLREFLYISTKEELVNKIEELKRDESLYIKIIEKQNKIDLSSYIPDLTKLLL